MSTVIESGVKYSQLPKMEVSDIADGDYIAILDYDEDTLKRVNYSGRVIAGQRAGEEYRLGHFATSEGCNNVAYGEYSHSEGYENESIGDNSHSEGHGTSASGENSHSEGYGTRANHDNSHASGKYTVTSNSEQTVIGKYNEGLPDTAFEIGNGSGIYPEDRSNAVSIYWDGRIVDGSGTAVANVSELADEFDEGTYYDSGDYVIHYFKLYKCIQPHVGPWEDGSDFVATKLSFELTDSQVQTDWDESDSSAPDYLKNKPALGTAAFKNSIDAVVVDSRDLVESGAVKRAMDAALSSVYKPSGDIEAGELTPSLLISTNVGNVYNITTSGTTTAYFVGGSGRPISIGDNVAIVNLGSASNPDYKFDLLSGFVDLSNYMEKGVDYVTAGKKTNTTLGNRATAEGINNTASGVAAHAEGGYNTASGYDAHAEGSYTTASALDSHAEGSYTVASHESSHAEGAFTQTGCSIQHVQGRFNIGKPNTAFEIGNGTEVDSDEEFVRSNAFEVDWDGNVVAAGSIMDGSGHTLNDKVDKSGDLMTGDLHVVADQYPTTETKSSIYTVTKIEVEYRPDSPTSETGRVYYSYYNSSTTPEAMGFENGAFDNACFRVYDRTGNILIDKAILTLGDSKTFTFNQSTQVKTSLTFMTFSTVGRDIIDSAGNKLSDKVNIASLGTAATKDTTDTYVSTGTDPITGKGVASAIGTLDVASVGGSGKYITTISETDGKISATASTADTTVTSGSSNLITSGAVYTAIANLDVASVGGSSKYLISISETDGKISATTETKDTVVTQNSNNLITSGAVYTVINNLGTSASKDTTDTYSSTGTDPITGKGVAAAISTLDVSSIGGSDKYLTTISETDGKISATAVTADVAVIPNSSNLVTSGAVYAAIDNLPKPMLFKGSLGTDGTITSLPPASLSNEGYTYKVITAGVYDSLDCKVGDIVISNGNSWVLIPSGDDSGGTGTDTWRNIKVNGTEKLGNSISTGAVDFVNGTNTTVSYNSTGNKVSVNIPTATIDNLGAVKPDGGTVLINSGELSIPFDAVGVGDYSDTWVEKDLGIMAYGWNVWTDGYDTYYSTAGGNYILNKNCTHWEQKTFNGFFTYFDGQYVWTDGTNIYYSLGFSQYKLNRSSSTWEEKTWSGYEPNLGNNVWKEGSNIYYSDGIAQYMYNKSNSTWSSKTWNGFSDLKGQYIWTDGNNIYYSYNGSHYVLNKSTSTWEAKTWNGATDFDGDMIWSAGDNVYLSYSSGGIVHKQLNKSTSTWEAKTWNGYDGFLGSFIWKDKYNNIYNGNNYVLGRATSASSSQFVLGNDVRLSDARTPLSHTHTKSQITDLGTAAGKNITISTTDLTPGTSALATGDIYIVYET